MRPHSTTLCGRCRFLSLLVILARGFGEQLSRMPLPAVLSISICRPVNRPTSKWRQYENHHSESLLPHLTECVMLEVSDEIAVTLSIGCRLCDSYKRRKREHDECSLDNTLGFEADVTFPPLTPEQMLEDMENRAALYAAINQLPHVQARRVYAYYVLDISRADLARAEGVGISRISSSIDRGLLNLKNILENSI